MFFALANPQSPFSFLKSLDSTDAKDDMSTIWASPKKLNVGLKHVDGEPRSMYCSTSLKNIYSSFSVELKNDKCRWKCYRKQFRDAEFVKNKKVYWFFKGTDLFLLCCWIQTHLTELKGFSHPPIQVWTTLVRDTVSSHSWSTFKWRSEPLYFGIKAEYYF